MHTQTLPMTCGFLMQWFPVHNQEHVLSFQQDCSSCGLLWSYVFAFSLSVLLSMLAV